MDPWLSRLVGRRRVFVCVGPGGVGKTSMAGAIALRLAESGLSVLCLTIDPAKRLAQALGLAETRTKSAHLSPDWFLENGVTTRGSLDVMMLDVKETLRELVLDGQAGDVSLDKLLASRPFQFLLENVMGMQSYMAMERVLAVDEARTHDVIVLDTPPSSRALDFFDAPNRMLELLQSPLTRVLARAQPGSRSRSLFERGAQVALRGLGKITGSGFLEELGAVLGSLGRLLVGFEARAERARARFTSSDYGCLFITTPGDLELLGAFEMMELLTARGLNFDAMVLNRFVNPAPPVDVLGLVRSGMSDGFLSGPDERLAQRRVEAVFAERHLVAEAHADAFARVQARLPTGAIAARVPEFYGEIQSSQDLIVLSQSL